MAAANAAAEALLRNLTGGGGGGGEGGPAPQVVREPVQLQAIGSEARVMFDTFPVRTTDMEDIHSQSGVGQTPSAALASTKFSAVIADFRDLYTQVAGGSGNSRSITELPDSLLEFSRRDHESLRSAPGRFAPPLVVGAPPTPGMGAARAVDLIGKMVPGISMAAAARVAYQYVYGDLLAPPWMPWGTPAYASTPLGHLELVGSRMRDVGGPHDEKFFAAMYDALALLNQEVVSPLGVYAGEMLDSILVALAAGYTLEEIISRLELIIARADIALPGPRDLNGRPPLAWSAWPELTMFGVNRWANMFARSTPAPEQRPGDRRFTADGGVPETSRITFPLASRNGNLTVSIGAQDPTRPTLTLVCCAPMLNPEPAVNDAYLYEVSPAPDNTLPDTPSNIFTENVVGGMARNAVLPAAEYREDGRTAQKHTAWADVGWRERVVGWVTALATQFAQARAEIGATPKIAPVNSIQERSTAGYRAGAILADISTVPEATVSRANTMDMRIASATVTWAANLEAHLGAADGVAVGRYNPAAPLLVQDGRFVSCPYMQPAFAMPVMWDVDHWAEDDGTMGREVISDITTASATFRALETIVLESGLKDLRLYDLVRSSTAHREVRNSFILLICANIISTNNITGTRAKNDWKSAHLEATHISHLKKAFAGLAWSDDHTRLFFRPSRGGGERVQGVPRHPYAAHVEGFPRHVGGRGRHGRRPWPEGGEGVWRMDW